MKNFLKNKSLIIIIILLFVLSLSKNFNKIYRDIIAFSIIYIIIYWNSNKNIKVSIILSLILYFLLNLLESNNSNIEGFDEHNTSDKKEDDKQTNKLTKLYEKLDGVGTDVINLTDDDLKEKNSIKNYETMLTDAKKENNKVTDVLSESNASEMAPYQAQKETFHLINSVQQLSSTVKQLGPLLKEGKKVLEIYKHFKF